MSFLFLGIPYIFIGLSRGHIVDEENGLPLGHAAITAEKIFSALETKRGHISLRVRHNLGDAGLIRQPFDKYTATSALGAVDPPNFSSSLVRIFFSSPCKKGSPRSSGRPRIYTDHQKHEYEELALGRR
ncbi:hypothetical protein M378DRAFT_10157 [Amanita muscaria Koide BX008]|uniref:Uncharacterized protein n=1 Tax=Amanita muscaria (strain Koide BX008) TaxID=946122 RepID=A0A0C2THS8_AMAMK|nr:hypothetical protein M378DRAFT_10157 [Amanita muscaria Koide BX008]